MNTALLIIDVQQGLCEGSDKAFQIEAVIERINTVSGRARKAGVPVIFIQHEGKNGYLEFGTADWHLAQGLVVGPNDIFVRKTTPDAFHHSELTQILEQLSVTELAICGLHSEFCVDTTTRRALALGYPVVLIADGHSTLGNEFLTAAQIIEHHNATLSAMRSFGSRARVLSAKQVSFEG